MRVHVTLPEIIHKKLLEQIPLQAAGVLRCVTQHVRLLDDVRPPQIHVASTAKASSYDAWSEAASLKTRRDVVYHPQ